MNKTKLFLSLRLSEIHNDIKDSQAINDIYEIIPVLKEERRRWKTAHDQINKPDAQSEQIRNLLANEKERSQTILAKYREKVETLTNGLVSIEDRNGGKTNELLIAEVNKARKDMAVWQSRLEFIDDCLKELQLIKAA